MEKNEHFSGGIDRVHAICLAGCGGIVICCLEQSVFRAEVAGSRPDMAMQYR